jgi:CheY-like chemotaxis protein
MARVLVIDDDVHARATLRAGLNQRGHKVVFAESGRRGIAQAEAFAFDVVIVDIFMPWMDGIETIRMLRARSPGLPVIAISGYAFRDSVSPAPDFLKMALDFGAAAFLRKPFGAAAIVAAVERACGRICPQGHAEQVA